MKNSSKLYLSCILFTMTILLIFLARHNPEKVEIYYSQWINTYFISSLNKVSSFVSFSLHELLLFLFVIFLCSFVIIFIRKLKTNKNNRMYIFKKGMATFSLLITIPFFLFELLWGLNYYRPPFEQDYLLERHEYSTEDLVNVYEWLISEVNSIREDLREDGKGVMTIQENEIQILNRSGSGYINASNDFSTLHKAYNVPKPIFFSPLLSYTGITGMYSPFTGEANVNVDIPKMSIPVTAMHELAHQQGYASEDEANFIAFLTCRYHPDLDYQYSGYLLALSYTGSELFNRNESIYKQLHESLTDKVKRDMEAKYTYWDEHEGIIERISNKINDTYLKANGVTEGVESYSLMVQYLVGYFDKEIKSD